MQSAETAPDFPKPKTGHKRNLLLQGGTFQPTGGSFNVESTPPAPKCFECATKAGCGWAGGWPWLHGEGETGVEGVAGVRGGWAGLGFEGELGWAGLGV